MERLKHEIALLEMRSEQLRIHLRSIPFGNREARQVLSRLGAMSTKIRALKQFARTDSCNGSRDGDTELADLNDSRSPTRAFAGTLMPNKTLFIFQCDAPRLLRADKKSVSLGGG